MTPAINEAKKQKIPFTVHQYSHNPDHSSYGLEAVEALDIEASRVFKTLVVQLDNKTLSVAVVPVSNQLNMKLFAKAAEVKKAAMADAAQVEKSTGYVLGGVSPLGQKKRLPTIIDASAGNHETIFVSGGKRGLEIELKPADLCRLTSGSFAAIVQD
ncbi:Cys-tRNA(Pro) deacylase [Desulforhopalus sp. IMCC35007]|uniref:Cys-tRNA(Pro) deacylase n=1 Tax=Desulforhopalus sp. IMCC35007 TaxID=2569543 RepID=UPI0010AE492A|nr:Cys-tRNA(Pro) deacylase [Desulforhopalus sp. IMCC35007]TKB11677.1 Cys-tRNA(Pro) deacylase [Desulforhopalus sp. IMCC35007]